MEFKPSPNWSTGERIKVAATLAQELQEKVAENFIPREEVYDVVERIKFVLVKSPTFLEANRDKILEGNPPPAAKEAKG